MGDADRSRARAARKPLQRSYGVPTLASAMRDRYDFSGSQPNPYAKRMKRQITIRLDEDNRNGLPYQSLINLYLRECAESNRELRLG